MTITEWIPLIASIIAICTSVVGVLYQNRDFKQKEKELKHHMRMDQQEFIEKYTSHEARMVSWLKDLDHPAESTSETVIQSAGLPYQAGYPIRNPQLFYGRQEQLDCLMNCVNGTQMASMSILGARKSGKTSFFHYLKHVFNPDAFPRIVPVFLDAQAPISSDKNFYAYILREASAVLDARSKASARPPDIPKEVDFETLSTFLEQASNKQWRFVMLLDEFEHLMCDSNISGEDFFSSLRSLILRGNLSWITASFRAVYMPGTNTSPFINIIQETSHLGPLSSLDAHLLVSEPAASAGHPFECEDIDLIIELAGRMPYMLQKASLILYKTRLDSARHVARSNLPNMFQQDCIPHFQSQLSLLSSEEKRVLFLLSLQKDVTSHSQMLKTLENYGFAEKTTDGFQVLGKTFNQYIYQQAKAENALGN